MLPQFGYRQLDGLTFDHPTRDLEGTAHYMGVEHDCELPVMHVHSLGVGAGML